MRQLRSHTFRVPTLQADQVDQADHSSDRVISHRSLRPVVLEVGLKGGNDSCSFGVGSVVSPVFRKGYNVPERRRRSFSRTSGRKFPGLRTRVPRSGVSVSRLAASLKFAICKRYELSVSGLRFESWEHRRCHVLAWPRGYEPMAIAIP